MTGARRSVAGTLMVERCLTEVGHLTRRLSKFCGSKTWFVEDPEGQELKFDDFELARVLRKRGSDGRGAWKSTYSNLTVLSW